MRIIALCAVSLATLTAAGFAGETLIKETFSRPGPLAGRRPSIGETGWIAHPSLESSGTAAHPAQTASGRNALLPFNPKQGEAYLLSVRFVMKAGNNWGAFGFASAGTNEISGGENFWSYFTSEAPWATISPVGSAGTFAGPATQGGKRFESAAWPGETAAGIKSTLGILLDTRGKNWRAHYSIDGRLLRSEEFSGKLSITHVCFGALYPSDVEIEEFKLERVEKMDQKEFKTELTLSDVKAWGNAAAIFHRAGDEAVRLEKGKKLFSDHEFTVKQYPSELEGLNFLRAGINFTGFEVSSPGWVLIMVPAQDARDLQGRKLTRMGFHRLYGEDEFKLMEGQKAKLYAGRVEKGDFLYFSRWALPIGFAGAEKAVHQCWSENSGELLYNGIRLPEEWPPKNINPADMSPAPVPYLDHPPSVITVDTGRQLFVDDFLIEETCLKRVSHSPQKYENNPVIKPETEMEINPPLMKNAAATPKSGGVWWDPQKEVFKMWYEAGWTNTICYAESTDGINWRRPSLDSVEPGTNRILRKDLRPDSWTVMPDYSSDYPGENYFLYMQTPGGGHGWAFVSEDGGINWNQFERTGYAGDRSTHFYNPFRNRWIYSLRSGYPGRGRSRDYYESKEFLAQARWTEFDTVPWMMTDREDPEDPETTEKGQRRPQLYNFDAVAYESIMLGFFQLHHGPPNLYCAERGIPKITELMFSYSRDGFHFHRPDRRAHIESSRKDVWDRGYVQSVGGICTVRGDKLWIYYTAFQGNEDRPDPDNQMKSGMYDRGATGVAFLRRDGFASMDVQDGAEGGALTTRLLTFSGSRLFVNADTDGGTLKAEIQDASGKPVAPFTLENSIPFSGDSTIAELSWNSGKDISDLAGEKIRLRFELSRGSIYSFWISRCETGRSDGYVAAGGPGFAGLIDTVGKASYTAEERLRQKMSAD